MKASIRLCLQLVVFGLCSNAGAAGFPDRPIHLIVPFPPGGPATELWQDAVAFFDKHLKS